MKRPVAIALSLALIIAMAILVTCFSSCGVLLPGSKNKSSRRTASDSSGSHRVDSGRVVHTSTGGKSDSSYTRETIYFGRDTTVVVTPVNNYYPTKIVRETGTLTREDWLRMTDSMNRSQRDTSHVAATQAETHKETKPPSMWQLLGYMALLLVVFEIVKYVGRNLKWKS